MNSSLLGTGCIVVVGCLMPASAVKLRVANSRAHWTTSVGWIAVIAILFALGARGSQTREVLAAVTLVGAFPVPAAVSVARAMTSGLWLATALAAAAWLTALFAGVTFGVRTGLILK